MSYLVANPEDKFSRDKVHILSMSLFLKVCVHKIARAFIVCLFVKYLFNIDWLICNMIV